MQYFITITDIKVFNKMIIANGIFFIVIATMFYLSGTGAYCFCLHGVLMSTFS
ncbi:MAG: hypothetical protein HUJ51_01970 [Eggerthellaceae bacterium]|nr:hypothetical protein [Eggerthellaceae bacterium]